MFKFSRKSSTIRIITTTIGKNTSSFNPTSRSISTINFYLGMQQTQSLGICGLDLDLDLDSVVLVWIWFGFGA